jgi:hypothetical protein
MKRALLAILILVTGTTIFCSLRGAVIATQRECAIQKSAWQTQTQQLVQLRFEKSQLAEHWRETERQISRQTSLPALTQLEEKILSGVSLQNLSAAESKQLLAELDFNWHTTGDFIIVSKPSLAGILFNGLKGTKLTEAARAVLAVTPDEQMAIEAITQQLGDTRTAWDKEHVQRTEPNGDMVAQYTLPADAEFSQSQVSVFTNGILSVLGDQRAQWLQDHSVGWMQDSGLLTGPDISKIPPEFQSMMPISDHQNQSTSLTLNRYQSGDEWNVNATLKQAGNNMTYGISPWQPFPAAFSPLFPGGWKELAQREGFQLPKTFENQ